LFGIRPSRHKRVGRRPSSSEPVERFSNVSAPAVARGGARAPLRLAARRARAAVRLERRQAHRLAARLAGRLERLELRRDSSRGDDPGERAGRAAQGTRDVDVAGIPIPIPIPIRPRGIRRGGGFRGGRRDALQALATEAVRVAAGVQHGVFQRLDAYAAEQVVGDRARGRRVGARGRRGAGGGRARPRTQNAGEAHRGRRSRALVTVDNDNAEGFFSAAPRDSGARSDGPSKISAGRVCCLPPTRRRVARVRRAGVVHPRTSG